MDTDIRVLGPQTKEAKECWHLLEIVRGKDESPLKLDCNSVDTSISELYHPELQENKFLLF